MRPIITLTTDFGLGSPYVAQMKGVILSIFRDLDLLNITHAIGPQNVREGAIVLADVTPRFPAGTIHVAVIDPGVGTARRIVYVEASEQRYLVPDNGLLSFLTQHQRPRRMIALEDPQFWLLQPSNTFHGRDIFAPVAAHLARGLDPAQLGSVTEAIVMLDWPKPQVTSSRVAGEVLYVDSFGNLITNVPSTAIGSLGAADTLVVECGGQTIRGIIATYGAALPGELVALIDSQNRLEVAIVNGNAARALQVEPGAPVVVLHR
jgi:S-adenosyl-L-methionine hydrolase (adenosine-forming)